MLSKASFSYKLFLAVPSLPDDPKNGVIRTQRGGRSQQAAGTFFSRRRQRSFRVPSSARRPPVPTFNFDTETRIARTLPGGRPAFETREMRLRRGINPPRTPRLSSSPGHDCILNAFGFFGLRLHGEFQGRWNQGAARIACHLSVLLLVSELVRI
jgi:hypothetical protein